MNEKKENNLPEGHPVAEPEITPEMVQSVVSTLEAEGLIHYSEGGAYVPTEGGWKLLRENVSGSEFIHARGHEKIVARDEDCFEITTRNSPDGEDSVICVSSDKGCGSLSSWFKNALKTARKVLITVEAGGLDETITAFGSPALSLEDDDEIVIRKSDFIDSKTLAILADKSANDFSEDFKKNLRVPGTEVKIKIELK